MSLTGSDLQSIRAISREENAPIEGKVEALANDVKEIYYMLAKMQNTKSPNKKFMKLNLEDKIRSVYEDLQLTAKQAGIALPH